MYNLKEFEEIIGYNFDDSSLLKTALTHSSFVNEKKGKMPYNERLEFLGDSVLSLIVSRYLFENYPDMPEGDLTKSRALIVCERSLYDCAMKIELGRFIILGKGEELTGGRKRLSILADAYEALIAAMYLDSNLKQVREWLLYQLGDIIKLSVSGKTFQDYKTELQEKIQAAGNSEIVYKIVGESGPDHRKSFAVIVEIDGKVYGSGEGSRKKSAEQNAAKDALYNLSL